MPYKSKAQQGWAHTPAGTKALGGKSAVAEWDKASKGLHLPAHANMMARHSYNSTRKSELPMNLGKQPVWGVVVEKWIQNLYPKNNYMYWFFEYLYQKSEYMYQKSEYA